MENRKQFKITKEFKDSITNVLGRLPFERINKIMPLIEKDILSEQEINAIISEMGRMAWFDVKDFFAKLSTLVEEITEEVPKKVPESEEKYDKPKLKVKK